MQNYIFLVPIVGWFCAVVVKTLVNFIYYKQYNLKLSFSNGGFPSAHTATVISTTTFIGFYDGFNSTLFLLAETISFIVLIDATHLRRSIGKHATILNHLMHNNKNKLHETEGHSYFQVFGGGVIGVITGYLLYYFL